MSIRLEYRAMPIGTYIKEKRKKLGISQKAFSHDICTQSMMSKIERNEIEPSRKLLIKISNRLDISIEELEKRKSNNDTENIKDIESLIRLNLDKRNYDTISLLINSLNLEKYQLTNDEKVFFKWIKATIYYYKTSDYKKTLKQLDGIDLNGISNNLNLEILNAKGRILYLTEQYEKANIIYNAAYSSMTDDTHMSIKTKLTFNYVLTLENLNESKAALSIILTTIDYLVSENSLYLLGDFYHTKGHILRKLGDLKEAKKSNELAMAIFEIQNNNKFRTITQVEIREIDHELKK